MRVLMVLLVLGAPPAEDNPSIRDVEFLRVQIDWIAENVRPRKLEDVLPRRDALLIRQLGCRHFACRELADEELCALCHLEALLWGTRSTDPEVRSRAKLLLAERYYACPRCDGIGYYEGPAFDEEFNGQGATVWHRCYLCWDGDARYQLVWDGGEEKVVRRDLFRGDQPD